MAVRFADSLKDLMVPIDSIIPWDRNPRSGDMEALIESIKANGFFSPLVVQRSTGKVLAGNHRLKALEMLGEDKAPVVYMDVDDEQATRLALADNRVSDLALYDDTVLLDLLRDMNETDAGLEGTGYDRQAFEILLQSIENEGRVVGGVRQGVRPDERIDEYNDLEVRSLIMPFDTATYEQVVNHLLILRETWGVDSNAEVLQRLAEEAVEDLQALS